MGVEPTTCRLRIGSTIYSVLYVYGLCHAALRGVRANSVPQHATPYATEYATRIPGGKSSRPVSVNSTSIADEFHKQIKHSRNLPGILKRFLMLLCAQRFYFSFRSDEDEVVCTPSGHFSEGTLAPAAKHLAFASRRRGFSLDSPLYRTRLPENCRSPRFKSTIIAWTTTPSRSSVLRVPVLMCWVVSI